MSLCTSWKAAKKKLKNNCAQAWKRSSIFIPISEIYLALPGGQQHHLTVAKEDKESVAVRAATMEDCGSILDCLALAFAPYRDAYTPDAYLDTVLTPDSMRTRMAQMSIFVAESAGGRVVGTIACKALDGGRGHLRGMAVRPEWHGSGVSACLLKRAEEELRKAGCTRITLNTTEPLKRALRFYEKYGFQPTGRHGSFFGMTLFEYRKPL
jgi:GNAT superfamily N-acetyltransferase